MNKKIIIYRNNNSVVRVQIKPENVSDDGLREKMAEYNSNNTAELFAESVTDSVAEAVAFLIKDRNMDLNRHMDSLRDIKNSISDIDDYLYSIVRDIKEQINQNKE